MNTKDKSKLLTGTRIYLTESSRHSSSCYEMRIKLPMDEFVVINLTEPLPSEIEFRSLKPDGFGYDVDKDPPITDYGRKEAIRVLNSSINYSHNNPETVKFMIDIINQMQHLINPY